MNNIEERVAAGLRNMKSVPDAFIFLGGQEWVWDKPSILGKPVFHSMDISFITNFSEVNCLFMPLWFSESDRHSLEVSKFINGYSEY